MSISLPIVLINTLDIFVDTGRGPISEKWLVIQMVVFVMSEPGAESGGLIEKPLVKHCFFRGGLSLPQSNFLRYIPIIVSLCL